MVSDEIERGQPVQLVDQPLIKAQAKDYVRQTQERLIGEPVLRHLTAATGQDGAELRLLTLLENWRNSPEAEQGYRPSIRPGYGRGFGVGDLEVQGTSPRASLRAAHGRSVAGSQRSGVFRASLLTLV